MERPLAVNMLPQFLQSYFCSDAFDEQSQSCPTWPLLRSNSPQANSLADLREAVSPQGRICITAVFCMEPSTLQAPRSPNTICLKHYHAILTIKDNPGSCEGCLYGEYLHCEVGSLIKLQFSGVCGAGSHAC